MKKLLPLALLFLAGCEQAATPDLAPQAQSATQAALPSTDSYMTGYAKYEQCLWGKGICGVAVTEASIARTGELSTRTPRVRLTLRQSQLDVKFLSAFDATVDEVTIRPGEEFFVAQPETEALGARAIKVKRGTYRIDRSWGEFGGVRLNAQVF